METGDTIIYWENLEGRKIVNVWYIFETILSIKREGFDCSFCDLQFIREINLEFFS